MRGRRPPRPAASWDVRVGDAIDKMKELEEKSIHCCMTSPPYFGLRDYGVAGQIGLEPTPAEYVSRLVDVFREVRRVLRDDGTLWLNLGDTYGGERWSTTPSTTGKSRACQDVKIPRGGRPKDLLGIPWRVAFALQADGWYLRSDIIWCLSGGAWLYAKTQKGEMPVMVKDLVRLNPATVKLWNGEKWTQVLGWNRSTDTETRLEIVLRSGERIGCTGNHQWPTQRGNVRAAELRPGDVIRSCILPESSADSCPQYLTEDALWLIGIYLAEGSMSDDTIQISGHADEVTWLERIGCVARYYGGSIAHTLDGNNLSIRLYGRVLRAILETYVGGQTAHDKHLKVASWLLPRRSLRMIAEGYLDGDGHKDEANHRTRIGFCRNYSLERDLRTLAARLGATLTLVPTVSQSQWGKYPSFRGEWRWERSGHHNEKDRGEVVAVRPGKGRTFWDIGVADEPHLFSLASGILTHNSKPNPMPESVRDRPTKAHEYVFLLAKNERYHYDADAVREPFQTDPKENYPRRAKVTGRGDQDYSCASTGQPQRDKSGGYPPSGEGRNRRSVWTIATRACKEAHFAVMPEALVEPCILAGCPEGGTVLDPFTGAGTTGRVAVRLGRSFVGIELKPEYAEIARRRIAEVSPP